MGKIKLPGLLWVIIIFTSLVGLIMYFKDLAKFSDLVIILTFDVLIFYTYYTYLLAKEARTPSASFSLQQSPNDPYIFFFILRNHSKVPLQCWCRLNASVEEQPVSMGGFYEGESSFDLQPYGISNGWFDIRHIIARANRTIEEFEGTTSTRSLYLDIEFWYNPYGREDEIVRNVRQPHYFDFRHNAMVADF